MKLIIAIIQPSKLEDVKKALSEVEVVRLTIMDCQGFGRQKGQAEVLYKRNEFTVNLLRKVQLMIAVNESFVEPTINAIIKGGRTGATGEIGDGKIFVLPLEDCIRIRTGERGGEAILRSVRIRTATRPPRGMYCGQSYRSFRPVAQWFLANTRLSATLVESC